MQALTQELERSFEAFLSRQGGSTTGAGASAMSSIVSSSSSSGNNGHELRRTARRLERSLTQMEAYCCCQQDVGYSSIDQEILQHASHLLADILTLDEDKRTIVDQQDWMHQDILQLYEQACVSAVHLLSLVGLEDAHVDALLDRVGEELYKQNSPSYSPLLVSLMKLLDRHLQETPILPLLSDQDSIWLTTIMTTKCIKDLKTPTTMADEGSFAMRSFLVHFLRHICSLKDDHDTIHDWYKMQVMDATTPEDAAHETNSFFRQLETLGQETLESVLDLLIDTTSITTILNHAASAMTMVEVLEKGFGLSFVKNLRSLFVGLVNAVVQHKSDQALDLVLPLAQKVLKTTAARDDKAVQHAASMILYLTLGHEGVTEDASFLLEQVCSNNIIPSALLASLLLPTAGDAKETIMRLVQACPTTNSPWNHIIARKIPATQGRPIDTADRVLQVYAHQYVPTNNK